jgi:hypothetical protein
LELELSILVVFHECFKKDVIKDIILEKDRVAYVEYVFLISNETILMRFSLAERIKVIVIDDSFL